MFLLAILEFRCIECFAYALPVLFLIYSYVWACTPALLYPLPFFSVLPSWNCYICIAPHTCKALLSFVLFSLTLSLLTLLVVPRCPKVVMMTLAFTDKPEISFFSIYILCSCCCYSTMNPSTSSYCWFLCSAAMGCSPLYFIKFTSTRYQERLILYSLYPILDSCSFSKFIDCCFTCRRNGTGSFSLISPDVSFLNSKISLYLAASRGLVSSSVYEILWGIWIPAHALP